MYSITLLFCIPASFNAASYEPVSYGRPSEPAFDSPFPFVMKYSYGTLLPKIIIMMNFFFQLIFYMILFLQFYLTYLKLFFQFHLFLFQLFFELVLPLNNI